MDLKRKRICLFIRKLKEKNEEGFEG